MVTVQIQVPDSLAQKIYSAQKRLPEILALGLKELSPVPNEIYRYILEFLISRPSPQEIVKFGPTPEMQERASELLEKNRAGSLTKKEKVELDEYVKINHLVTLLKAHWAIEIAPTSTKPAFAG